MKFLYALRREMFALHARAPQNLLRSPAAIPKSVPDQRGQTSLVRHGQGCGEGCGCVCDVQVWKGHRTTCFQSSNEHTFCIGQRLILALYSASSKRIRDALVYEFLLYTGLEGQAHRCVKSLFMSRSKTVSTHSGVTHQP